MKSNKASTVASQIEVEKEKKVHHCCANKNKLRHNLSHPALASSSNTCVCVCVCWSLHYASEELKVDKEVRQKATGFPICT